MRRLVLLRHGESVWNAEARIQGQRCAGLSALGHEQAEVTATMLAARYPDALLVSSDLQRTVETAAPLAAALQREPTLDAGLRERTFGGWEGQLRTQVAASDAARWARWLAGEDLIAEVGGESAAQLADRVEPVLRRWLAATPLGGVTIAVTHGGPVWHGTHRLLGLAPGTLGGVSNAAITELVAWGTSTTSPATAAEVAAWGGGDAGRADEPGVAVELGAISLDRWNETAHLPAALTTGSLPAQLSDGPPVGR